MSDTPQLKIISNNLTEDEIRVLSLLKDTAKGKFGELTIQVHDGRVVSAEVKHKIRF